MKLINIMKDMYDGSQSYIRVDQGKTTDFFNVDSGVRQGDSLLPLLFNIVLDFVMRKVEIARQGIEWRLKDLAYADDICLLANDLEGLRILTEATVCEASKVGLRVSTRKTEIMCIRTNQYKRLKSLFIWVVKLARTVISGKKLVSELARRWLPSEI